MTETGKVLSDDGTFITVAGGGAPATAQYLVGVANATLTAERVVTDTAEVTWDLADPAAAKANVGAIPESKVTGLVADLAAKVPTTRLINTTAPLTGGGDLTGDRTLAISDATTTAKGAVELATDGESAALVVVQGNDARMSNARPPNGAASGDLTGTYPGPTIAADAVSYAEMQNISAASKLLGRGSAAGLGDPEEITLGTNLSMSGTTLNASGGGSTPTGTGYRHVTGGVEDAAAVPTAGTVFPTSPTPFDGQLFYRTDHKALYFRDVGNAAWLSVAVYEFMFGSAGALNANVYFRFHPASTTSSLIFSATVGHLFFFDVVVVGLVFRAFASQTNTTIAVTDDGVNVVNGTLNLTGVKKAGNELMFSNTLLSGSIIGVRTNNAMQGTGAHNGMVRLRRIST